MKTANDREKQKVTAVCAASDRLQALRMIYRETRDNRILAVIRKETKEMKTVVKNAEA